jgi:hypothetical protein
MRLRQMRCGVAGVASGIQCCAGIAGGAMRCEPLQGEVGRRGACAAIVTSAACEATNGDVPGSPFACELKPKPPVVATQFSDVATPHPTSIAFATARFHDIDRLEYQPVNIAVVHRKTGLGTSPQALRKDAVAGSSHNGGVTAV